jgi:hypothetical protein
MANGLIQPILNSGIQGTKQAIKIQLQGKIKSMRPSTIDAASALHPVLL